MAEHCSFGKWNYELSVAVKYWSNQWFKMTLWNLRGKKTKPPNPNPSSLIDCKINWPATCQYHAILKSSSHLPLSRSMQSSKKKKKKKLSCGKFSFPPVWPYIADAFLLLTMGISSAHILGIATDPSRQTHTPVRRASSCWIQQSRDEQTAPWQKYFSQSLSKGSLHFRVGCSCGDLNSNPAYSPRLKCMSGFY